MTSQKLWKLAMGFGLVLVVSIATGRVGKNSIYEMRPHEDNESRESLVKKDSSKGFEARLQEENSKELQLHLLRRWAASDPAAAAEWIDRMPVGDTRQEALASVAIEWANRDLPAAAQWARELHSEMDRRDALLNAASEAVRFAPAEAVALAGELPADAARDELMARAAGEWAATDPAEATTWAEQITDDGLRQRALAAITTSWSDHEPEAAANLALQSLIPGRLLDDALISIVQRWAQKQPEMAAGWVERFPPGPLRETALENMDSLRSRALIKELAQ